MSTVEERPPVVLYPIVAIHYAIIQKLHLDVLQNVHQEAAWRSTSPWSRMEK
jgi:hypothetical protein